MTGDIKLFISDVVIRSTVPVNKTTFIPQTLATSLSHNTINGQQIRQSISLLTPNILGGKPCVLVWKRTALEANRDDCYV